MNELSCVESLTESQIDQLQWLYESTWWAQGRSKVEIRTMLEQTSLCLGLVEFETDRLVGFCRVLTDFVFRGMIFDVIIAEDYRNRGLGRLLMDHLSSHPRLQSVSVLWLCCLEEMVPFYEKWGFEVFDGDLKWMKKVL